MTDRTAEAHARSAVYRLLSTIFLWEPTVDLLEALSDRDVHRLLSKFAGKSELQLADANRSSLVEQLAVEYARLFVGPGFHVYPYESMYVGVDGLRGFNVELTLCNETTSAVEAFYLQAGIVANSSFRGLPDHIGVELECMAHLTAREASSWERINVDEALASIKLEAAFLSQHLVEWLPGFSRRVRGFEAHPFYSTLTALAARFVKSDLRAVTELLQEYSALDEETGEPHETTATMCSGYR